jgi:hypothetical protein
LGIRFTSWFVAEISQPQPGVKIEYASYLRASPRRRAWMHASGAIVTKLIPLAVLPVVVAGVLPGWVGWALVALFLVMVVTDVLWSTRASDWRKFRREMALVQDS